MKTLTITMAEMTKAEAEAMQDAEILATIARLPQPATTRAIMAAAGDMPACRGPGLYQIRPPAKSTLDRVLWRLMRDRKIRRQTLRLPRAFAYTTVAA